MERTFLRNDGGTVWIFGIKTEGRATVVDNRNGSVEINGTGLGMTNHIPSNLPLVRNENGRVSIINGTSTNPGTQHPTIVREIRNGVVTNFSESLFSYISTRERTSSGGLTPAGRWIVYTTGAVASQPPAAPSGLTATAVSSTIINLTWTDNSNNETAFIIERRTGSGAWVEITTVAGNTTNYAVTGLTPDTTYSFRVRAYNLAGDSAYSNVADASTSLVKLSGTIIGTTGSYNNSGNDRTRVFDNNLNTFFDGPTANGVWVGLDLGTSRSITRISFALRSGFASRMVGGYFQVSNSADFSNATTIHTINTTPTNGVLTTVNLNLSGTWRYIRYVSPNGGWGNIAEMEVWGY